MITIRKDFQICKKKKITVAEVSENYRTKIVKKETKSSIFKIIPTHTDSCAKVFPSTDCTPHSPPHVILNRTNFHHFPLETPPQDQQDPNFSA